MAEATKRIAENLATIREQMAAAARRSGRDAADVRLVAVTKYVASDVARCLVEAGCLDLGESRPQQLWEKADQLADPRIRWHAIGHLQRNKLNRTLPLVHLVHSLDSLRLAEAIDQWAVQQNRSVDALLEVNVSGDAAKHGFRPDEVRPVLAAARTWGGVRVQGLMAMAGRAGGPEQARRDFAGLRQLRDQLRIETPDGPDLTELSMGMSGDFPIAIEEGATLIRVGSALFEGLPP